MARIASSVRPNPVSRGLLRWRDLRQFVQTLKNGSSVEIAGAHLKETPNGLSAVFAQGVGAITPLFGLTLSGDSGDYTVSVSPGIIMGSDSSFIVPTLSGDSIFSNNSFSNPTDYIYIYLEFEPVLRQKTYGGTPSDYYSMIGTHVVSCEIRNTPSIPSSQNAQFNKTTGTITQNGIIREALGRIDSGPTLVGGDGYLMVVFRASYPSGGSSTTQSVSGSFSIYNVPVSLGGSA